MLRTAWLLIFVLSPLTSASEYNEVLATVIGPRSRLSTNNTNNFNLEEQPDSPVVHHQCDIERFRTQEGHEPCAADMRWVCSRHFQISLCVDYDIARDRQQLPRGNLNRTACANYCAIQGKRLPSNNEWLVACTGSEPANCLNYEGEWPPGHFAKILGHPCQVHGATSSQCFSHPDLTRQLPTYDPRCRSEAGLIGCIGSLGQWAAGPRSRFNGGLFPQPASSVLYTTTAHSPVYSDYSIGCRCAQDIVAE